ncbi:MAG: hypothetical protein M3Y09_10535, partial [Actinomycetota bacterium]|nr:hypothetical protein [Actinomycetota bacterium]
MAPPVGGRGADQKAPVLGAVAVVSAEADQDAACVQRQPLALQLVERVARRLDAAGEPAAPGAGVERKQRVAGRCSRAQVSDRVQGVGAGIDDRGAGDPDGGGDVT